MECKINHKIYTRMKLSGKINTMVVPTPAGPQQITLDNLISENNKLIKSMKDAIFQYYEMYKNADDTIPLDKELKE